MSPMASKRQFILLLCAWNTECVSAMVDCDDVQYSNDKIDEDEYIDNCIPEQWRGFFRNMDQVKLGKLASDLVHESKALNNSIEPKMPLLFNALKLVKGPQDVKVVIVGQDPTPQKGKATGLAFSVENPRRVPAVLNVLLEVAFEGFAVDLDNGDLSSWAHQGVLLLNAALTVPQTGAAKGKHRNMWKDFTSYLVKHISENAHPSVWLLWGRDAKAFRSEIEKVKMYGKPKHLVIEGGHPSPVSFAMSGDSFFGGGYFLCANRFLRVNERDEINWSLTHYRWKSLKRCPPVEKSETEIRQNFKNRYKHKIQQIEYLKNYHKQEQNRLTQERQTLMSQKGIMPPQQCKGSVEVTLQNYDLHENQLKLLEKQENQIKQQEEEELKKAHEQGPHILLQVKQIEPFELQLLQQWSHLREQQQQQQQQHQQHQQQQQLQQQQQHQQHQQQQHQLL